MYIRFCEQIIYRFYSKQQSTVESWTCASESTAMKQSVYLTNDLRCKLRMMVFSTICPTSLFCDNSTVVVNITIRELTLKCKYTSTSYHQCREVPAAGTVQISKEGALTNLAGILTKFSPGLKIRELVGILVWQRKLVLPL